MQNICRQATVIALMSIPAAFGAEPPRAAGLVCMLANDGQGSAPVYDGPTSGTVVNRSMPVVLAVAGDQQPQNGRVHIRTPSNHDGWVEARLLKPHPRCTPVMMRDPSGRPLLGFK